MPSFPWVVQTERSTWARASVRRCAYHRAMSTKDPVDEAIEAEAQTGDIPDEESFPVRGLDTSANQPHDEPLVGSLDDLENGSEVGWSD